MRLLIVEDEVELSNSLKGGLEKEGYAVDCSLDGEDALFQLEINQYDLVILDLNLPKVDGLDVLKFIKTYSENTKIIILSARVTVEERIRGLEEGADDYLVKPFDFGELLVRIRNLVQREFVQRPTLITFGELILDTNKKVVKKNNKELLLTRKEYGILEYLVFNKGNVISAEEIINHVWNDDVNPFSSALRYHVSSLKKKIMESFDVEVVRTIRGQGYIIDEESDK
ncbi:response regulator transcription factor [Vagococcus sp. DIV0080]|uniref:Response regulator transcription factor n=1 Tax=Candidatus Vagococcus giribetii TaxID=2230876 RepID=A0ABS3HP08_9ENTE|nr:response regulator transcription factor [Vagococcus sp. DIV0080]MBO0475480.1 response regulator transcription factor [Vagococcus sp. DIV0080]